ncbi:hypothetical protein B9Z19DRAFT_1132614 [Tuber borchii]|uniref:Uncharacterized protein n=1 Tax=Tuber borchii TaxID=42251 RepID=A0A2T6ZH14_TUBBO|nr:hypothetical protein B9Z19DRAFT_1132614 [Tuber borchii]
MGLLNSNVPQADKKTLNYYLNFVRSLRKQTWVPPRLTGNWCKAQLAHYGIKPLSGSKQELKRWLRVAYNEGLLKKQPFETKLLKKYMRAEWRSKRDDNGGGGAEKEGEKLPTLMPPKLTGKRCKMQLAHYGIKPLRGSKPELQRRLWVAYNEGLLKKQPFETKLLEKYMRAEWRAKRDDSGGGGGVEKEGEKCGGGGEKLGGKGGGGKVVEEEGEG